MFRYKPKVHVYCLILLVFFTGSCQQTIPSSQLRSLTLGNIRTNPPPLFEHLPMGGYIRNQFDSYCEANAPWGAVRRTEGEFNNTKVKHTASPSQPNVVIIYTDDQNYKDIGCYGGNVYTPNIDMLAENGLRFTGAYATTAICTPSRYGLLTGRYPSRSQDEKFLKEFPEVVQTEVRFNTHLSATEANLARIMQQNGYQTGVVGKWDFGTPEYDSKGNRFFTKLPQEQHWLKAWIEDSAQANPYKEEVSAILKENHRKLQEYSKQIGFNYADALYFLNPEMLNNHSLNLHNMEWVTQAALDFIDGSQNKPFFLYMAPTLNHIPHPQESLIKGDPHMTMKGYIEEVSDCMPPRSGIIDRVIKAGYPAESAYNTWMDDAIGAVVDKLKSTGVYDNTLIILMSDHQSKDKCSLYESGVKTPLIIHYPVKYGKAKVFNQLVQNIDITPTVLEACNIQKPTHAHIDGKSILPLLDNKTDKIHDALFFEYGWTRAIRTENWKYLALRYSKAAVELKKEKAYLYHDKTLAPMQHEVLLSHPNYWDADQLYNMHIDKIETTNLAYDKAYSDTLELLKSKMEAWLNTFGNHPFGEFNNINQ